MDLVTVGTYNSSMAAEMAKNFLMDEGIQAFVEEGATGDMLHLGGEVKVQVAAKDAEQARELLEAAEFHPSEEDDDEE